MKFINVYQRCMCQQDAIPQMQRQKMYFIKILEPYIATKFALALFRNKNEALKTLDKLRYQLTTTSNKSASELLPTDDAFYQHVLS